MFAKLMLVRCLWGISFCLGTLTLASPESTCAAEEFACQFGKHNISSTGPYYWPMAMGHPNYYSNPPWPGPTDLQSSFSWQWFGPTGTRYEESFVAAVIDDKKNIYVNGAKHVYKLSPDGVLIWTYQVPGQSSADGPALYDGNLHGATEDGKIYAVDMETGIADWVTQASTHGGGEYSHLAAHKGVVVTRGDPGPGNAACGKVRGLNSTNGAVLWTYDAEENLWDWFPQFPDDDSVIFMSFIGSLFKVQLHSGELLWKNAGTPNTWTDGSQFVASNGLTYAVEVSNTNCRPRERGHSRACDGYITAYKTSDGSKVWRITVPKDPNTSPVVGRLRSGGRPSLVMPIGRQSENSCEIPTFKFVSPWVSILPEVIRNPLLLGIHQFSLWLGDNNGWLWGTQTRTFDIYVFDAESGKLSWTWSGPTLHRPCNCGDEDGIVPRFQKGIRLVCCPTPWTAPRIGTDGTIFVGAENGDFFAIRDVNGDDRIDDANEVSVYSTGATFPHCGSAHAPGMVVAVNFDGVFVWKS